MRKAGEALGRANGVHQRNPRQVLDVFMRLSKTYKGKASLKVDDVCEMELLTWHQKPLFNWNRSLPLAPIANDKIYKSHCHGLIDI